MDRDAALARLAGTYASALRLADEGLSHAVIAEKLGIDAVSVEPLLAIGREKLAHLMDPPDGELEPGQGPS